MNRVRRQGYDFYSLSLAETTVYANYLSKACIVIELWHHGGHWSLKRGVMNIGIRAKAMVSEKLGCRQQ
jgi:hypothetical protein